MADKTTEILARMWILCDPNRGAHEPGSGFHPDDIMQDAHGDLKDKPRWHWFIPRAEASKKFLAEHGLQIVEQPDRSTKQ